MGHDSTVVIDGCREPRHPHGSQPTVTLDADTEALVRRMMSERGLSFKRALALAADLEDAELTRRMQVGK